MRGIVLVEIVVGVGIIAASLLMLTTVGQMSIRIVDTSTDRLQATVLLSEGVEAVKTIRDRGWTANIGTLAAGASYYLAFNAQNHWEATTTPQYVDGVFTRTFVLADVERNASDDIVASGGTVDSRTKKVTVTVSWDERGKPYTESITTYITNLFND